MKALYRHRQFHALELEGMPFVDHQLWQWDEGDCELAQSTIYSVKVDQPTKSH